MTDMIPTPEPTALEPCPRCWQTDKLIIHENDWCEPPEWVVQCGRCPGSGHQDRNTAIAAWNTRVPSPEVAALRARVEALEKAAREAIATVDHNLDTKESPHKYVAPWAGLTKLRLLIEGAALQATPDA